MDATDRRILDEMQEAFPLTERPFEAIARRLGSTEDEILARVQRLKDEGVIRQIGAIFDSAQLGYRSALAAFQVDAARVDEVAAHVNAHPGVTHNYLRAHAYNLWFTLTVAPPGDPRREAEELARRAGCEKWLYLPALRVFKIGVRLRMSEYGTDVPPGTHEPDVHAARGADSQPAPCERKAESPRELTERDRAAVRVLQRPLRVEPEPFRAWAEDLGVSVAELLETARRFLDAGLMRRFAALLHQRQAGYAHNALTAWEVLPERVEEVGRLLAGFDEVSHCYERPVFRPDWPYALFAMIHARSETSVHETVERMRRRTHVDSFVVLPTLREFKKARVEYFTRDMDL